MRRFVSSSLSFLLVTGSVLPAADLPVKEVTLYKHGIGYFERAGTVAAGDEVRLDFKNNDMNDERDTRTAVAAVSVRDWQR